jgi:RHS repeat-associated protein
MRQVIDEQLQTTTFTYNLDDTFKSVGYANCMVPTPAVSYTYDQNYERLTSMTDGTGTTLYSYFPITGTAALGAGRLASVDGPLTNDTIAFGYDELGRRTQTAINGVATLNAYDAAGRLITVTNVLGSFSAAYDGSSGRLVSQTFPNGQSAAMSYSDNFQDFMLQQISYTAGATPISQFIYGRNVPADRITAWSQQAGAQPPSIFSFGYDSSNQLLSATVTNAGTQVKSFAYSYDLAGNRLSEQASGATNTATYNALNQLSTATAPAASRTNEWDAAHRLTAVNAGNQRTEFTYDGQSRLTGIRQLLNGVEVSHRLLVWNGSRIAEERDTNGVVTKRFFAQGVKLETGTNAGSYYYTRDHLGSIRELTDASGQVRARYTYDPFGRRTKVTGDLDADLGFAGMFRSPEASLYITHFRAYDPELGRWLSRDPLRNAEMREGPNLYAYAGNEPVSRTDREGLCTGSSLCACFASPTAAAVCIQAGIITAQQALSRGIQVSVQVVQDVGSRCAQVFSTLPARIAALKDSLPQIVDEIATYRNYAATLGNASYITGWLPGMIRWDRDLFEAAEILAPLLEISNDEAYALLAEHLGENPETWLAPLLGVE